MRLPLPERHRPHALMLCSLLLAGLLAVDSAQAGKLYLMGDGYSDTNTDLFVNGLRKATGIDSGFTPNVNSTANCVGDWATTRRWRRRCARVGTAVPAAWWWPATRPAITS
ncbi:MAG: hypothetical protein ACK4F7_00600 [Inhella sp.]